MSKNISKKVWTDSYSGRGTALLDMVEGQYFSRGKKLQTIEKFSYRDKLRLLLRRYPNNTFYDSLHRQLLVKGFLSSKQIGCINSAYDRTYPKSN